MRTAACARCPKRRIEPRALGTEGALLEHHDGERAQRTIAREAHCTCDVGGDLLKLIEFARLLGRASLHEAHVRLDQVVEEAASRRTCCSCALHL